MISVAELDLVPYPHPALRRKAVSLSIPFIRPQLIKDVVARMFELMYANRGVGLAATQIGLPWQLFITDLSVNETRTSDPPKDRSKQMVYINPVITVPRHARTQLLDEACLSIPGISGEVLRPQRDVTVEAFNENGKKFKLNKLNGLHARVVQHEFDHLRGVLYIDHLHLNADQRTHLDGWLNYLQTQYTWMQNEIKKIPSDDEMIRRLDLLEAWVNQPEKSEDLPLAGIPDKAIIAT